MVGSEGALYHFIGTVSCTFDTNTNHSTQLAYSGTVTDVCATLSWPEGSEGIERGAACWHAAWESIEAERRLRVRP